MKIAFGFPLIVTAAAPLWLRSDIIGEGLVPHLLLHAFWAMKSVGAPLCLGSVSGTLGAMYRKRQQKLPALSYSAAPPRSTEGQGMPFASLYNGYSARGQPRARTRMHRSKPAPQEATRQIRSEVTWRI